MRRVLRAYFTKPLRSSALCALALLALSSSPSYAQLKLPLPLTAEVLQVRFEVDSTWHLIHGTVPKVEGLAKFQKENDPASLSVEARFGVAAFDTDNSSRDSRLREVMKAEAHPQVEVTLQAQGDPCKLQSLAIGSACSQEFQGSLRIAGVSKSVQIPVRITRSAPDAVVAQGSLALQWADYGVEDPSILVARLNPSVTVHFELKAPYGGS